MNRSGTNHACYQIGWLDCRSENDYQCYPHVDARDPVASPHPAAIHSIYYHRSSPELPVPIKDTKVGLQTPRGPLFEHCQFPRFTNVVAPQYLQPVNLIPRSEESVFYSHNFCSISNISNILYRPMLLCNLGIFSESLEGIFKGQVGNGGAMASHNHSVDN